MKNKIITNFIKKIQSFILNNFKQIQMQELRRYIKIASAVFCVAVFVIAISVAVTNPSVKTVIAQATTVKPETFTELYFEDHLHLPRKTVQKALTFRTTRTITTYSFSFTIHNLENKDMNYPYEVYTINNDTQLIDQGTVLIRNNESKTITENFTLPTPLPVTKILVSLPEKNQQISFWMGEQK